MERVQCDERRCPNQATHETILVASSSARDGCDGGSADGPVAVDADRAPEVLWARLCDEHELTDDDRIVPVHR